MLGSSEDVSVVETVDYFGSLVKFKQKNYDKHKDKHPELRNKQFCPGQITMALEHPTLTIAGKREGTLCYYLEILRIRDIIKYAKIVVREVERHDADNPHCIVMTAFKIDHIQELKYGLVPTYYNNN